MKKLIGLFLLGLSLYPPALARTSYNVYRIGAGTNVADFGTIDISQNACVGSSILNVANGGTNLSSGTSGGLLYFSASGVIASSAAYPTNALLVGQGAGAAPSPIPTGTPYQVLRIPSGGGAPAYGQVDISQSAAVTGTLPIARGGTGQTADGTLGQVLTSGGSGQPMSWSNAGAYVLLNTQTASNSASIVFSSTYITSTYKLYKFSVKNLVPATNAVNMRVDFSTNNGSSYVGSPNFYWAFQYARNDGSTGGTGGGSAGDCNTWVNVGNTASQGGVNSELFLTDPSNSTTYKQVNHYGNYIDNNGPPGLSLTENGNCGVAITTAVNAIKFSFSSGNITSGSISLYGVTE